MPIQKLKIASGKSCLDTHWLNETMELEEFEERLKNTTRTSETMEEFLNLSSGEKNKIKDVGGFVGGYLKDGKRTKQNVESRSMLTLDADHCEEDFIEHVVDTCKHRALIYSTHKHTKEHPRIRIIIPLSRDVSCNEYTVLSKYIAKELGEENFDEVSFNPAQMMYWPSTSKDGEYVFRSIEGEWMDPDSILAGIKSVSAQESLDSAILPSLESTLIAEIKTKSDPKERSDIVGAFCRAYPPEKAIATFLNDIYEPTADSKRYRYRGADSTAGLVIYGSYVYSFHSGDPASNKSLHSYDLVKLHKFGDNKSADAKMLKWASELKDVKRELVCEKYGLDKTGDTTWLEDLHVDIQGKIESDFHNFKLILEHDENLSDIRYNLLSCGIDIHGEVPWKNESHGWGENDRANLISYLNEKYEIYSPSQMDNALRAVASQRAFHPIKEWLEGLPKWDRTKRVDTLLIDYLGAEDSEYVRAVTRKTLIAAVARIYDPGVKFDTVLILSGPQGCGKSTLFAKLGGKWFSDSLTFNDMKDKAAAEKLQGYWILELAELSGMNSAEAETVKSFITRTDDIYRPAYAHQAENHPRQSILVASTNAESGFLNDTTGNRRFWPVSVSGKSRLHTWNMDDKLIGQIWAEALQLYHDGETLYLDNGIAEIAIEKQEGATFVDDRIGLIKEFLDTPINHGFNAECRQYTCALEVLELCFGKIRKDISKKDLQDINDLLRQIEGWRSYSGNSTGTLRLKGYGKQRAYERINPIGVENKDDSLRDESIKG